MYNTLMQCVPFAFVYEKASNQSEEAVPFCEVEAKKQAALTYMGASPTISLPFLIFLVKLQEQD